MVNKTLLQDLAKQITEYSNGADEALLKAAALLQEARAHFGSGESGATTWTKWAEENLDIGASRLRELLRIARDEDPKKALERQRAQTRERVKRHRADKKSTTVPLRNGTPTEISTPAATPDEAAGTAATQDVRQDAPRARQGQQPSEPETTRRRLRDWVETAPIEQVEEVWRYVGSLKNKEGLSEPRTSDAGAVGTAASLH